MSEGFKLTNQEYRELAEKIESGEYFNEATDWYLRKYMYQFIERSYLFVTMAIFASLILLTYLYYESILPIKKSLPIQVNISSAGALSTRITYLGNEQKNFDINDVFMKYLSGRFVEAIESYDYREDFKKLRINKNIINSFASADINEYYLDKISIRNADSFILKYRKKVYRLINVDKDSITLKPLEDKDDDYLKKENPDIKKYLATVNFTSTEVSKTGNVLKTNWQAKFVLSFQTIKYNSKKKEYSPLNYKVLNYESKRID